MKMFFCVWEGKTCRFARIIVSSWSRRSNTRYCGYHVKVLTLVKKKKKKNESGWIVLAQSPSFCFIGCLEAVYIGGYLNSVDNAEKEVGGGEKINREIREHEKSWMAVCWIYSCPNTWKAVRVFKMGHKFCVCACVTQTGPIHLFTSRPCQRSPYLFLYSA